jgi:hypothetical protein
MSCGARAGYCLPTCMDADPELIWARQVTEYRTTPYPNDTRLDGLSMTGVIRAVEGCQIDAEARTSPPWAPMWAIVVIFLGMALTGFWFARHSIAYMIWSLIHA